MGTGKYIRAVDDHNSGSDAEIETVIDGETSAEEDLLLTDEVADDETYEFFEEGQATRSFTWVLPTIAVGVIAAWSGFFGWANSAQILAGITPQVAIGLIVDWSIPVLLVVAVWLLAMRNSSREASRFGDAARLLSDESALLEQRLTTVNRELSLAREFLGSQSQDLEFLGRSASERISEHADKLQALITVNGTQIDAIAGASANATDNMSKLRDDLPVIANSAKDVTNQIGNAGRAAHTQLGELVAGFERLNEFGQASERQVQALSENVDETLATLTAQINDIEEVANARFDSLRAQSEEFRIELDSREVVALAGIRGRAEALRKELAEADEAQRATHEETATALKESAFMLKQQADETSAHVREGEEAAISAWSGQVDAMRDRLQSVIAQVAEIDAKALDASKAKLQDLAKEAEVLDTRMAERSGMFFAQTAKRRADFDTQEEEALARLDERLAKFDRAVEERRARQTEELASLIEKGEAVVSAANQADETVERLVAQSATAETALTAGAEKFAQILEQSGAQLTQTNDAVTELTDASVRLLELIQASAKHSKDELPTAIHGFEASLETVEERAAALNQQLSSAQEMGDALAVKVSDATERSVRATEDIEEAIAKIGGSLGEQATALDGLQSQLTDFGADADAANQRAQGELRHALRELEESSKKAIAAIETDQAESIRKIAERVSEQSAQAIEGAISERSTSVLADLDIASAKATSASRAAAEQLHDQLSKVNELVANIEARVAQARERAEEQVDSDFSRRVALITESLNSNAIDIGKALSTEVTDTAWASYLRGDRGIFTRRAVHLMDSTEAREIAELYDADSDFREHVSRYIHDFEAMLRTLLSTRDGNAVSVTLLGSDMGKLYVALAQSLERLRQ